MRKDHCDGPECGNCRASDWTCNDWLKVSRYGIVDISTLGDSAYDRHFCSYGCLRNWAQELMGESL